MESKQPPVDLERESSGITGVCIVISFAYLLAFLCGFLLNSEDISKLKANEIGDFIAGMLGPVGTLWLIAGYMQQRIELKQNTAALRQQANELANSVFHQQALSDTAARQLEDTRAHLYATRLPNLLFVLQTTEHQSSLDLVILLEIINTGEACTAVKMFSDDNDNVDIETGSSAVLLRGGELSTRLFWDIEDSVKAGDDAQLLKITLIYTSIDIERFSETWTVESKLRNHNRTIRVVDHHIVLLEKRRSALAPQAGL